MRSSQELVLHQWHQKVVWKHIWQGCLMRENMATLRKSGRYCTDIWDSLRSGDRWFRNCLRRHFRSLTENNWPWKRHVSCMERFWPILWQDWNFLPDVRMHISWNMAWNCLNGKVIVLRLWIWEVCFMRYCSDTVKAWKSLMTGIRSQRKSRRHCWKQPCRMPCLPCRMSLCWNLPEVRMCWNGFTGSWNEASGHWRNRSGMELFIRKDTKWNLCRSMN